MPTAPSPTSSTGQRALHRLLSIPLSVLGASTPHPQPPGRRLTALGPNPLFLFLWPLLAPLPGPTALSPLTSHLQRSHLPFRHNSGASFLAGRSPPSCPWHPYHSALEMDTSRTSDTMVTFHTSTAILDTTWAQCLASSGYAIN